MDIKKAIYYGFFRGQAKTFLALIKAKIVTLVMAARVWAKFFKNRIKIFFSRRFLSNRGWLQLSFGCNSFIHPGVLVRRKLRAVWPVGRNIIRKTIDPIRIRVIVIIICVIFKRTRKNYDTGKVCYQRFNLGFTYICGQICGFCFVVIDITLMFDKIGK